MSHVQAIRRTVAAANSGNAALAKTHLQKAAEAAPEDAAVWLWLGWFAESPVNAVQCLEMAVEDERYRDLANAGLAWARAMANFRLAEDGPICVAPVSVVAPPQTALRSAAQATQVEITEHHAEKLLAAKVAQVAAEVAQAVAIPALAPVAAVPAQIALGPANVEAAASSELLTTIAALSVDSWTGLPVAASSRTPAPTPTPTPIAESPLELTATQTLADAIRPSDTSFGRASLWSGLGLGAKRDSSLQPVDPSLADAANVASEPVSPPSPHVETPRPFVTAMESFGSSVTFSTAAASAIDAEVVPATVTPPEVVANWSEPPVELAPTAEETAAAEPPPAESAPPAPASAPGLWRAMKSNWFSSQPPAENKLGVEPIAAERAPETSAPATRPMSVKSPTSPVLAEPGSRTASPKEPLFAWQHESVEAVPQPARSATREIDIAATVDVFEDDELAVEEPHTRAGTGDDRAFEAAPDVTQSVQTILVVDDSPTVRKLVAMTLEKRGFKVVSAFDGVAAIKEIAAHNPALILMDINMPRLDGYQLCKLVKQHESTRNIPVVMLSGKDGMFDRLRGRLVGCSGYITKPFVPEELVDAVDEYLAQAVNS